MADISNQLERTVAVETSILLAVLCEDHGLEFSTAVKAVERALTKSYWGRLPEGHASAIVEVTT